MKVEKGGETKRIGCLEMALYETYKNKEMRRNYDDSMPWGGPVWMLRVKRKW